MRYMPPRLYPIAILLTLAACPHAPEPTPPPEGLARNKCAARIARAHGFDGQYGSYTRALIVDGREHRETIHVVATDSSITVRLEVPDGYMPSVSGQSTLSDIQRSCGT